MDVGPGVRDAQYGQLFVGVAGACLFDDGQILVGQLGLPGACLLPRANQNNEGEEEEEEEEEEEDRGRKGEKEEENRHHNVVLLIKHHLGTSSYSCPSSSSSPPASFRLGVLT